MRFLLPPSETKNAPARGAELDVDSLALPGLAPLRRRALEKVAEASARNDAAEIFGVSEKLLPLVRQNAEWETAPTARASAVYDGVLYSALGYDTLDPQSKRRAGSHVLVFSALFGVVGLGDRIFAYRASGGTKIPGIGPGGKTQALNSFWKAHLAQGLDEYCEGHLVVDTRSGTYAGMYAPAPERTVTIDVLQHRAGALKVVSHFAKHTRGELLRAALTENPSAKTPEALADWASAHWPVELIPSTGRKAASLRILLPEDHVFTRGGA